MDIDGVQTVEAEEADVAYDELWDSRRLGGIMLGARKGAGYTRMSDLVVDMQRATGVRVSENTLYDIESGKRLPSMNTLLALELTLGIRPEDLCPAVVPAHREAFRKLVK